MMALPTAGGEQVDSEGNNELRNLEFGDSKRRLNNSSSAQIRNKAISATLSANRSRHSRQGSKNSGKIYENEQRMMRDQQMKVVNDEELIKKVQQFNDYMDQKKQSMM